MGRRADLDRAGALPAITDQYAKRQAGWQVELHATDGRADGGLRTARPTPRWCGCPSAPARSRRGSQPNGGSSRSAPAAAGGPPVSNSPRSLTSKSPTARLGGLAARLWLGIDARAAGSAAGRRVHSADGEIRVVSSGAAITLLAKGNADIYCMRVFCFPVSGLGPARSRSPGGAATAGPRSGLHPTCRDAAGTQKRNLRTGHSDLRGAARQSPGPHRPPPPGILTLTRQMIRKAGHSTRSGVTQKRLICTQPSTGNSNTQSAPSRHRSVCSASGTRVAQRDDCRSQPSRDIGW